MTAKRIGYGYRRHEREFAAANVEQVWIDQPGTERLQRTRLLREGVRRGDTLVLLAAGDLGAGGELRLIRGELDAAGVAVELCRLPKPVGRPGPKPVFDPTPEQDEEIKALWHDTRYSGAYVLRRARDIMGSNVQRHHLTHRYKSRKQ